MWIEFAWLSLATTVEHEDLCSSQSRTAGDIQSLIDKWLFADRLRFAIGSVGYVCLLKAFRHRPGHLTARVTRGSSVGPSRTRVVDGQGRIIVEHALIYPCLRNSALFLKFPARSPSVHVATGMRVTRISWETAINGQVVAVAVDRVYESRMGRLWLDLLS